MLATWTVEQTLDMIFWLVTAILVFVVVGVGLILDDLGKIRAELYKPDAQSKEAVDENGPTTP